jgi:hypothetical protein
VRLKDKPDEKPLAAFVIHVHETRESIRQASRSLFRRCFDLPSWGVFALGFLPAALAFGAVYLLTENRDRLLAEEGKAELYRIANKDGCFEVAFGLGRKHGIQPGDELLLETGRSESVGTVRVKTVFDQDSIGEVDLDCKVRPGCIVTKPRERNVGMG